MECYDELGTRYSIPVYCLSLPVNLVQEADRDSPADFSEPMEGEADTGVEIKVCNPYPGFEECKIND